MSFGVHALDVGVVVLPLAAVSGALGSFGAGDTIDGAFALTGADTGAQLDGQPVLPWWRGAARAGQVLRLGTPRRGAWPASRAYLCLAGGVDVPRVLGSRSTQLRAFGRAAAAASSSSNGCSTVKRTPSHSQSWPARQRVCGPGPASSA